jgi:hypothetical protein
LKAWVNRKQGTAFGLISCTISNKPLIHSSRANAFFFSNPGFQAWGWRKKATGFSQSELLFSIACQFSKIPAF